MVRWPEYALFRGDSPLARRVAFGRLWILWIGGAVAALALAVAALNATSVPLRLARHFAARFEEQTGLEIELSGARFTGLGELRLEGVTIASAGGAFSHGEVAEVRLRFDPTRLFGAGAEGLSGSVDLIRPRLVLRGDAHGALASLSSPSQGAVGAARSEEGGGARRRGWNVDVRVIDGALLENGGQGPGSPAKTWRVDGRFSLGRGDGASWVERLSFRDEGAGVALTVSADARRSLLRWSASGPAVALLEALPGLPFELSGAVEAEGTATPAGQIQEMALLVTGGELVWGSDPTRDRTPFDRLELELARAQAAWNVRSLAIAQGDAVVRAEGSVRLPEPDSENGGAVELRISAGGLDLPAGIAPLEALGFRGRSHFSGRLSGSFDALKLAGRLSMEKGSVWHRPVDRAEGGIELEPGIFRFTGAQLVEGDARYEVSGEIVYGESPVPFWVELEAANGRVEEVLAAAGLEANASGRFDGVLHFSRAAESLVVEGDVTRGAVEIMGERFQSVQGNFRWNGEVLRLAQARAGLRGGVAEVAGEARGGALAFEVSLSRWPLAVDDRFPLGLPSGAAGWISYTGRLAGRLDAPVLSGELVDGEITFGRLRLTAPQGRLEITPDEIRLGGVRVSGAGDGVYILSGAVGGWREDAPLLDLGIDVVTASLSGLFHEGGLEVPALLLDGNVSGRVNVSGPAEKPSASFDLALGDDLGGEPIRLRFDVEDGKVRLGRAALAALLGKGSAMLPSAG